MKKGLRRVAWGLAAVLLLVTVLLGYTYYSWSRSPDHFESSNSKFAVNAKRNDLGVWKINARDEASLAYGMGSVQAIDREFQTEAARLAALGRLSELFGEKVFSRDRILRQSSHLGKNEWDALPLDHPIREFMEAYVQGHNDTLKRLSLPLPLEFRLLKKKRLEFGEWQAWELFAIVRMHAWEFSFDLNEDFRALNIKNAWGEELARILLQEEPKESRPLYAQEGVQGIQNGSALRGKINFADPVFIDSRKSRNEAAHLEALKSANSSYGFLSNVIAQNFDPPFGRGLDRGASNAWLLWDPARGVGPTLCNDTHLGFLWPSPLYPIQYEIKDRVKATGYALPGLPTLVIGNVERLDAKKDSSYGRELSWGITLATYANAQDLIGVELQEWEGLHPQSTSESFVVFDSKNQKAEVRTVTEEWTRFGLRVDPTLEWAYPNKSERGPILLDWVGLRNAKSPIEFFYDRTVKGAEDLQEGLRSKWGFPSVNFTFIERFEAQEGAKAQFALGHLTTGVLFKTSKKSLRHVLSLGEAKKRAFSKPHERPFVYFKSTSDQLEDSPFSLVSGNQKVWSNEISDQVAHDWYDDTRTERLLAELKKNPKDSRREQLDFFIPVLKEFLDEELKHLRVESACSEGSVEETKERCKNRIERLKGWSGVGDPQRFETAFVGFWFQWMKAFLLPEGFQPGGAKVRTEFQKRLHRQWLSMTNPVRAWRELRKEKSLERSEWERLTGRNLDEVSEQAFKRTNAMFDQNWEQQKWGAFHPLRWTHFVAFIPGKLGSLIQYLFFGPERAVPGGFDSPGRFDISWSPDSPDEIPAVHGAVIRWCREYDNDGRGRLIWSNVTGTSGNPLSKWSRAFSEKTFFSETWAIAE